MIPKGTILTVGMRAYGADMAEVTITRVAWHPWSVHEDGEEGATYGVVFYTEGDSPHAMALLDFIEQFTLCTDERFVAQLAAFEAHVKNYLPRDILDRNATPSLDGYGYQILVGYYHIIYSPSADKEERWSVRRDLSSCVTEYGPTLHDAFEKCVKGFLRDNISRRTTIQDRITECEHTLMHTLQYKKLGTKDPF